MLKISVVLCTYNGEKYIEQQIESILNQEFVDISLFIRDDGSTDNTTNIIEKYIKDYDNIFLEVGKNLGFANSFYALLCQNIDADYYAFSDQDDIWDSNKIIEAIRRIDTYEGPALYGSNLKFYDMSHKLEGLLYKKEVFSIIENQMTEYFFMNNPYGCTLVWNSELNNEIKKYRKPSDITHDTWMNLLANCLGKVYLDYNSYINYRLHGGNACGTTPRSLFERVRKFLDFYYVKDKSLNICSSCKAIQRYFPRKKNKLINSLANYNQNILNRIKAILELNKSHFTDKKKIMILTLLKKI